MQRRTFFQRLFGGAAVVAGAAALPKVAVKAAKPPIINHQYALDATMAATQANAHTHGQQYNLLMVPHAVRKGDPVFWDNKQIIGIAKNSAEPFNAVTVQVYGPWRP